MAYKKRKLKKIPKKPKSNATPEVWQRYAQKCKDIENENKKQTLEYEKGLKTREKAKDDAQKAIERNKKTKY